MKSILEELFYGNVCTNTDCRSNDEQTKELSLKSRALVKAAVASAQCFLTNEFAKKETKKLWKIFLGHLAYIKSIC